MTKTSKTKVVKEKGWACYSPKYQDIWSAFIDKEMAILDREKNGTKTERIIPVEIHYKITSKV